MKRCNCGSFAINKDPKHEICDVCYAYKEGFAAGQDAEREKCKRIMKKIITSNIGCGDYKHNCAHFNELAFDAAIRARKETV